MRLSVLAGVLLGAASICQGAHAQIEQSRAGQSAFSLGTLTPNTGAMDRDLWAGAEAEVIEDLLIGVPVRFDDNLHLALLKQAVLSPGEGPSDAGNALAARKFLTAARAGFYRDAQSLAELVPGLATEPSLSRVVAYAELLDGKADQACARGAGLRDGRTDPFWVKLRFVCYVRAGERDAAELTLNLLRRQDAVTDEEARRLSRFASGGDMDSAVPANVFDWVMMAERDVAVTQEDIGALPAVLVAAVARDDRQPIAARTDALLRALAEGTIDGDEARGLLDDMPTSRLTDAYLAVSASTAGSLEQYEALAEALGAAGTDYQAFTARARLFADQLTSARPVENFAPDAGVLALAGMVLGDDEIVERWLMALANDSSDETSPATAGDLINLYAMIDPGAARRIGSYLTVALDPAMPDPLSLSPEGGALPVASYVRTALNVAEARGSAPAALLYLTALNVSGDRETAAIRDEVAGWARDRADLTLLDRRAAFRTGASQFLGQGGPASEGRLRDGKPIPRIKPEAN